MFLGTQIIIAFLNLHTQMIQNNFGVRAGYELNCFIYNKILNYSPSSFTQRASHGEIVNFIQIQSVFSNYYPCQKYNRRAFLLQEHIYRQFLLQALLQVYSLFEDV